MSIAVRIGLIVVSILVFVLMMRRIRKEKLLILDAVFWIFFSAGLLIFSIFPQIIIYTAKLLGFYSAANLVWMLIIFVLLVKLFFMSLHISHTDCQLRQTVQSVAVLEQKLREMEKSKITNDEENSKSDKSNNL